MARTQRFEFIGGGSSKFWEISYSGPQVTVRFGRIGSKGQTQTKDLGSEMAAAFHVADLIKEKLAKGYVAVGRTDKEAASMEEEETGETRMTRPPALPHWEPPALPENGPALIDGITLPAGRRLTGNATMAPPGIDTIDAPVLWLTDEPVADAGGLLSRLREPCSKRHFVPLLLAGMEGDERRPWDSQEFAPTDPRRVDHFAADQVLPDMWRGCFDEEDDESLNPLQPFGREWPGLAAPPATKPPSGFARLFGQASDPNDDRVPLKALTARRVALVTASRPADAITALGWMGAVNVHQDPVLMSAVLRSWEDRWAARVVEIGFDTLTLTVGVRPRDDTAALRLAAEHFAFCPDNIWQGADSIAAYAPQLREHRVWHFWWD